LKAPNTPALLVELGFLSSAKDRKNLQDAQWRQDTIESMIEGMEKWYVDTIPKASFSEKN
jgi:N-acetylmuramoyl-L-alanine amidase